MFTKFEPRTARALSCMLLAPAMMLCGNATAQAAVTISSKATQNMNCSAGVCAPTAPKANLNVTDLANMLASGDAKVVSDSAALDIGFTVPLSWTNTSRLTLDSYHSITFEQPISVTGTGALTITTNDGGSDGDFSFEKKGHIEFWDLSSNLLINGSSYTLVKNIQQLAKAVAKKPSGAYALARNYNAAREDSYSASPIPTGLTGAFDGLGNTISRLTISTDAELANIGFFAELDSGGAIRHIVLSKMSVTGPDSQTVGGLIGTNNGGTVQYANVDASVSALNAQQSGILAGASFGGTIDHSATTGSIAGWAYVGGLVGNDNNSRIIWSHSGATVSAVAAAVGGLVGSAYSGDGSGLIQFCYATGAVVGMGNANAGGLVGGNHMQIDSSFAIGNVETGDGASAGGLVGRHEVSTISNGYALGSVNAGVNSNVGGLVGYKIQALKNAYSIGPVSAGSGGYVGGSIGLDSTQNGYNNSNLYWDTDTSEIDDPHQGAGNVADDGGISPLTTAQLQSGLPTGFDPAVWGQNPKINNGYPYLLANPPPK